MKIQSHLIKLTNAIEIDSKALRESLSGDAVIPKSKIHKMNISFVNGTLLRGNLKYEDNGEEFETGVIKNISIKMRVFILTWKFSKYSYTSLKPSKSFIKFNVFST